MVCWQRNIRELFHASCFATAARAQSPSSTLDAEHNRTVIQKESTLHLVLRLRGGAKKRKKKTYNTPKRIKHKRKKTKMGILKYYKVDSDGKIKRLRRECPNAECGAGVFMAFHHDRQYCGKCGLTYKFAPGTKPTI